MKSVHQLSQLIERSLPFNAVFGIFIRRVLIPRSLGSFLLHSAQLVHPTVFSGVLYPAQNLVNRGLLAGVLDWLQIEDRFIGLRLFVLKLLVKVELIVILAFEYSFAGIIQNIVPLAWRSTLLAFISKTGVRVAIATSLHIPVELVELGVKAVLGYIAHLEVLPVLVRGIGLLGLLEVDPGPGLERAVDEFGGGEEVNNAILIHGNNINRQLSGGSR